MARPVDTMPRWASSDGWVELGDRVFVRRYAFYDQNIGVVLGDGEALVIDTRSTYGQAREIQATPARADRVPGHGRRRHPRPLRSRLRQRALPPGDDLGPRAVRDLHGADRRAPEARDRPRGAGPGRPNSTRSSSIRPTGRSPRRRPSRSADARSTSATSVAATPTTTSSSPSRARTSCSPATSSSRAMSRSSATATRSTGSRRRRRSPALVTGVIVPGHGDHAGRAFADAPGRLVRTARGPRPRCPCGHGHARRRDRGPPLPGTPAGARSARLRACADPTAGRVGLDSGRGAHRTRPAPRPQPRPSRPVPDPSSGRRTSAPPRSSSTATCSCCPMPSATSTRTAAVSGLYDGDTRVLSCSVLRVVGERPVVLHSDPGGSWHGTVIATNAELRKDPGDKMGTAAAIARQTISIGRERTLSDAYHERLEIQNHGPVMFDLVVELDLDMDAADIFEVRGYARDHRGELLPIETDGACDVTFGYAGLDGTTVRTHVVFDPQPALDASPRMRARRPSPRAGAGPSPRANSWSSRGTSARRARTARGQPTTPSRASPIRRRSTPPGMPRRSPSRPTTRSSTTSFDDPWTTSACCARRHRRRAVHLRGRPLVRDAVRARLDHHLAPVRRVRPEGRRSRPWRSSRPTRRPRSMHGGMPSRARSCTSSAPAR